MMYACQKSHAKEPRDTQSALALLTHASLSSQADAEKQRQRRQAAHSKGTPVAACVLDPLLAALAHFNSNTDLVSRINTLFSVLDIDDSKTLSFTEMRDGLRKLQVPTPILSLPPSLPVPLRLSLSLSRARARALSLTRLLASSRCRSQSSRHKDTSMHDAHAQTRTHACTRTRTHTGADANRLDRRSLRQHTH